MIVALVSHRRLSYAAMGDSALIVTDGASFRRLDRPLSHFVGYPMTSAEVEERLVRGTVGLERREWVIAVSDGFIDFAPGGLDAAVRAAAGKRDPDQLARKLVQLAFDGGAGDNVAVACVSPFDSPFARGMIQSPPERTFPP